MNLGEREFALMTMCVMALSGCTAARHIATAAEACDAEPSDRWQMLDSPPAQAEEMMAVRSGDRSIGALLRLDPASGHSDGDECSSHDQLS